MKTTSTLRLKKNNNQKNINTAMRHTDRLSSELCAWQNNNMTTLVTTKKDLRKKLHGNSN